MIDVVCCDVNILTVPLAVCGRNFAHYEPTSLEIKARVNARTDNTNLFSSECASGALRLR